MNAITCPWSHSPLPFVSQVLTPDPHFLPENVQMRSREHNNQSVPRSLTSSKFDTASAASNGLQLFSANDARYRVRFSTAQATDNIKLPYGDNDTKKWLEPIAHDNPSGGPGLGGGTQFLLDSKQVFIDEIFDTALGRALTPDEIASLIPGI